MGRDIDGIIEVKDNKWKLYREVDFEGTRDSPLWCYLFGLNCWKYNPPEYEDKTDGIFSDQYIDSNDCSPELKERLYEDDLMTPYYIGVNDISKIKYYEQVPEPYNRPYNPIYDEIFNEMRFELAGKYKDVRLVVWFDY